MEITRDQLEIMKYKALLKVPYQLNTYDVIWERAVKDSASFIEQHLGTSMLFNEKEALWNYAINNVERQSLTMLEFGVFKGTSINHFAKGLPDFSLYGFDSFEGLQEDWKGHMTAKGHFNLGGELPPVEENVSLIKGWFNETLPPFLEDKAIAPDLLHVDCDTYESAYYVLQEMAPLLRVGALVVFDEHHSYPNWRNGEYLAWKQTCETFGIKYEYRAFAQHQALVIIQGNASFKG